VKTRDRTPSRLALLLAAIITGMPPAAHGQTVHAVLFHSPTCPHCRQVITEDLPIFFEVYGGAPRESLQGAHLALVSNGTLAILFVDASVPAGTALYDSSLVSHPVGADRRGVPRLIVGDSVMVGSVEIPQRLHAIVRAGLAGGGTEWPDIPGLAEALRGLETAPGDQSGPPTTRPVQRPARPDTAAPVAPVAPVETADSITPPPRLEQLATQPASTVGQRVRRDPIGNGLAIVGLCAMVVTLGAVGAGVPARVGPRHPGLWLPLLAVAGAGVAAYLTYVETSGSMAVCGPVGDCNTVQQSEYARLFGIPVGLLGLVGYGGVIVLWVLGQEGRPAARGARHSLVAATFLGTVFSIYLTALEPFVIGATCMWCLSSAALMTGMLWLAAAWNGA
jgi:uncharacterized membrane protein